MILVMRVGLSILRVFSQGGGGPPGASYNLLGGYAGWKSHCVRRGQTDTKQTHTGILKILRLRNIGNKHAHVQCTQHVPPNTQILKCHMKFCCV